MLFDKVTSELIYNASVQIWDVTMGLLDMEYRKCVICLCKRGMYWPPICSFSIHAIEKCRQSVTTGCEIHVETSFSNFIMNVHSNFM